LKILVLIHEFPPIGGGGGRIAQDVADELARRGHSVTVMAPYLKGLPSDGMDEGAKVIRLPSLRRQPYAADLLSMGGYLAVGFLMALWQILKEKPQLIHVHFAVPSGVLAWLLSRITGVPYMLTTHLGDIPGGVPEKTGAWFRWIYPFTPRIWRDAARVTAISAYTRQLALQHYPVEIKVIPNGVALNDYPFENAIVHDPARIIFAGRMVSQKNPVGLVEVLTGLKDLAWTCTLLGDGPLLEEVRRAISFNGLEARFSTLGWVATDEVLRKLGESDILFLPSLREGIPMIGLQSLAMGLAVVASRVGGISELVAEGENGYLHAPDDLSGFQASLRKLLTDPGLISSMRLRSREMASKFALERIVDAYEEALQEALKRQ
jgi:L-malate glycosyltransferase